LKKRREKKGSGRKERERDEKNLQAGNTGRENFLEAKFLQGGYPANISILSS